MAWYAMYVPNGKEDSTKLLFDNRIADNVKFVILKRVLKERKNGQWHRVERKLFPGYILVNGDLDFDLYKEMRNLCPTAKILKGNEEFHQIDIDELKVLNLLTKKDKGKIEMSSIYKEDDKIKVIDGPLVGLEGLILSVSTRKGRAKVSIDFIGEKRVVELGVKMVEKLC